MMKVFKPDLIKMILSHLVPSKIRWVDLLWNHLSFKQASRLITVGDSCFVFLIE